MEVKPQKSAGLFFFLSGKWPLDLGRDLCFFFKLFLVTHKAGGSHIGASWARTAHASLGRDSATHFVCERGKI